MALEKQNGRKKGVGLTDAQIRDGISQMIARHVVQLSEHCSSIQIIATKLDSSGDTAFYAYGSGDLYARAKATEVWLEKASEYIQSHE